jgi:hypothetical protein
MLPAHVSHLVWRSIVPNRGSLRPPILGLPLSYVSLFSILHTDICRCCKDKKHGSAPSNLIQNCCTYHKARLVLVEYSVTGEYSSTAYYNPSSRQAALTPNMQSQNKFEEYGPRAGEDQMKKDKTASNKPRNLKHHDVV